jgi:PAS domain S-box-containing protein
VNQTVAALAGRTPAECIGRTVREMIGDAAWSALEPYYTRVIEGNETISNIEVNLHDHRGVPRTLLVNYFPIRDAARTIGMAIIGSEITERKQAERELLAAKAAAEQANVAKDRFLAALSHELRTPLSPIELSAHILETNPDDPALVRNRAAVIRRNVATEVRLIDDLLDVTRIAAGKLQLQLQSLDLHEVLAHTVEICEPAADTKQVRLSVQLSAGRHHVQGDAARLQQVFWNLLSNAIKFSPRAARIDIDSVERDGAIEVRVRDHGIGIASEHLPRLFDPFEQGAADVNRRYGGLGLGLAITQGLVRAHRGSVEVTSDGPGQGATFTVRLPLEATPAIGIAPDVPTQPAASAAAPAVGHVLLIEDHPDTLETMRWLLTNDGWRVSVAMTAREARAAVAREPFDLIISDLGLPDADGLELMPQLQAQRQVPAIALTGFGSEVDQKKTLAAGFALHLTKPVDLDLLTTSMRALARLPDSASVQ